MYPLEMWLQHQAYAHSGPQSQEIFSFIISGQIEWKKTTKKIFIDILYDIRNARAATVR